MKNVSIIGMGYVGLPLAYLCIEKGYDVSGIDIDKKKLESIKSGISPIKDTLLNEKAKKFKDKINVTNDFSVVKNSDVVIIAVPTPVDSRHFPDLNPIRSASENISKNIKNGQLIVIESTIYPGVTEEIVKPILEGSGLKEGKDFYLAHCPERIDPGNSTWTIRNLPRVVGGVSENSTKKAVEFYSSILESSVHDVSSVKTAEAVKIVENSFRDVNIAFVNELAMSFDNFGIDIKEVVNAAATKPFSFMPHFPSCGVGGHCIPVDPYYLIEKAKQNGFNHTFLRLAREINKSMPEYFVNLLIKALNSIGNAVKGSKIGVLGLAYKGGVDDIRESPSLEIIKKLKNLHARLFIYDPYLPNESNVSGIEELLAKSDYLVLLTDHPEFKHLDLDLVKENKIKLILDGKNCLDKKEVEGKGIIYRGVGR